MNVTLHSHGKKNQTTSSKLCIYIWLYRLLFVGGDIFHENQWESKQSNKKHMSAVKFSRWNLFKKKGVALTSLQPFFRHFQTSHTFHQKNSKKFYDFRGQYALLKSEPPTKMLQGFRLRFNQTIPCHMWLPYTWNLQPSSFWGCGETREIARFPLSFH